MSWIRASWRRTRYYVSFITVRPRRKLFWKLARNWRLRLWPTYVCGRMLWPNPHWWLLHVTLFKFCAWCHYEGWRAFARRSPDGVFVERTPLSALVKRFGDTTAGCAIGGGECWHCTSANGDPRELSEDETGETFELGATWTASTPDGTDHRFSGHTVCPDCGYRAYYEDGSM